MGRIYGTVTGSNIKHHEAYVDYKVNSQDKVNNKSNITLTFAVSIDSYRPATQAQNVPVYIQINTPSLGKVVNTTKSFNFTAISGAHSITMATWTGNVNHDSEGKLTLSFKAYLGATGRDGLKTATVSGSFQLSTIPRASSISSVTFTQSTSGSLGVVKITAGRKVSTFYHKFKLVLGSKSYTSSAFATTEDVTVATSWGSELPNATSGKASITLYTYTSSSCTTLIGSVSGSVTITVPSFVKPSISISAPVVVAAGAATSFGFVQNKSKAKLLVSGAIYPGSGGKISSYSITCSTLGFSTSSASVTTPIIYKSGTHRFTYTVKDSRGRTATGYKDIVVNPYSAPVISSVSARRCLNTGVLDEEGTYAKINATFSGTTSISGNTLTVSIQYKTVGSSTYTNMVTGLSKVENIISNIVLGTDKSFDINIVVKDTIGSVAQKSVVLASSFFPIDIVESGRGSAFGKTAEMENYLDVGYMATYAGLLVRGNSFHMGYNSNAERSIYLYSADGTHQCRLYGGNSASKTAIGLYDSKNSRRVLIYTDESNVLTSDAKAVFNDYAKVVGTGKIIGKELRLVDHADAVEKPAIKVVDGSANGVGMLIGAGGLVVIGGGEGASNYNNYYKYNGDSEQTHVVSDNNIYFATGCNNATADSAGSISRIIMNTSGYFYPEVTGAYSIGHNTYRFNNGYVKGSLYAGSSTIVTSDERAKTPFRKINNAKNFLMSLEPGEFEYLEGTSGRTHWGFKAQKVKWSLDTHNMGNCGVYVEEPTVEGKTREECSYEELQLNLRYEELIAPIVQVIQEQQEEIHLLRNEIDALKAL